VAAQRTPGTAYEGRQAAANDTRQVLAQHELNVELSILSSCNGRCRSIGLWCNLPWNRARLMVATAESATSVAWVRQSPYPHRAERAAGVRGHRLRARGWRGPSGGQWRRPSRREVGGDCFLYGASKSRSVGRRGAWGRAGQRQSAAGADRQPGCVAQAGHMETPLSRWESGVSVSIGAPGFEPGTSCSRSRRANRAALRPVLRAGARLRLLYSCTATMHRAATSCAQEDSNL
jgi:hypothetical protein